MSARTTSAAAHRRIDLSTIGNALVLLALAVLAYLLLRWQAEPVRWLAPDRQRLLWAAAGAGAYAAFVGAVAWARARRARAQALPRAAADTAHEWLVAYASQTGHAEFLARRSWQALADSGIGADIALLGGLDGSALARYRQALFVVSTTGEGDAPDSAARFVRVAMGAPADLSGLRYGVLALGDREYEQYCSFGHRLDHWLRHAGAQPLFDLVEVDNGEPGALRHWQHHLGLLAGHTDLPDWSAPSYRPWRLSERALLNPDSVGGPAFHIALTPEDPAELQWQAGDIAEIGPRNGEADVAAWLAEAQQDGAAPVRIGDEIDNLTARLRASRLPDAHAARTQSPQAIAEALQPLPHREYSIASLPDDGSLHLLVRQMRQPDGRLGSGSGWLTAHAAEQARIDLRIRRNPSFHAPPDARPMILIGNGTGIAGLRALLKTRIANGQTRNWLLFGERSAAHDFHYRNELQTWLSDGLIERIDLAFSRDGIERVYVQQRLREQSARLREWLDAGAAVYVCGSLEGMAPAVDAVLRETVGLEALEAMALDGRYRRDVY
ncbi:sulfite reductase flavoprotein subunit alpha [Lysobacter sp. 5GHs7-4]|uniref:sulfite reductase subunit alpha n=1 Tax=Lysobacter sp. 5GHs7-4 TaxID=2904253 RepID=UPI001E37E364|nr:sulfite reductase flavoprotein subunit alpha [Lysobacter sp. 5GHs7-4]UHQ22309.1 sulfite reductase flavoprotein subunit alpha [Lysobacter sp. 5GHs7-4]